MREYFDVFFDQVMVLVLFQQLFDVFWTEQSLSNRFSILSSFINGDDRIGVDALLLFVNNLDDDDIWFNISPLF